MCEIKYAFISHSNKEPDLGILLRLNEYLTSRKLCAWFDVEGLNGEKWTRQIANRIRNATVYVLIASERSLTSPEVKHELEKIRFEHVHHDKPIIPLVLDESYFELIHTDDDLDDALGSNANQAVFMYKYSSEQEAFERLGKYLGALLNTFDNNPKDFVTVESDNRLVKYVGSDSIVQIPSYVREICEFAFAGQTQLQRVIIPSSVEKIERGAFVGCENLVEVQGMDGVATCDRTAFSGSLVVIDASNGFCLNGVVFGGQPIDGVLTIPIGARTIANGAFTCCDAHTVTLPEGLEHVGAIAFQNSLNIKQLVFPKSLKSLGKRAFAGCRELNKVKFLGEMPTGADLAFDTQVEKEIE